MGEEELSFIYQKDSTINKIISTSKAASWYTFSPLTSLGEHTQLHKSSYIIAKTKLWWSMYIYLKPLSLSRFRVLRILGPFQGFKDSGVLERDPLLSKLPQSHQALHHHHLQLHSYIICLLCLNQLISTQRLFEI
jgi:hypothetical protein